MQGYWQLHHAEPELLLLLRSTTTVVVVYYYYVVVAVSGYYVGSEGVHWYELPVQLEVNVPRLGARVPLSLRYMYRSNLT